MAQFKNKNKSKFWHSPIMLIILFLLLIIFAYNVIGLIQKNIETDRNKIVEFKKNDELKTREAGLTKDIEKLKTTEGIEESIRDKFQVVKPGEKMVTIVNEAPKTDEGNDQNIDHSFWGYIKRIFSKK